MHIAQFNPVSGKLEKLVIFGPVYLAERLGLAWVPICCTTGCLGSGSHRAAPAIVRIANCAGVETMAEAGAARQLSSRKQILRF
jgi:hypothetical protein